MQRGGGLGGWLGFGIEGLWGFWGDDSLGRVEELLEGLCGFWGEGCLGRVGNFRV